MFKTNFSEQNEFGGLCPRDYGSEGRPDDLSFTKGVVRNYESLYPHCQLWLKQEL